jgi:glycosyltransferase involved in cell wall biosynthesis
MVYAELLPLLPAWFEQCLLTVPYIFDLDDAFYLKYRTGRLGLLRPFLGSKIDRLMAGAAAVTVGNHILEQYARRFNPSVVLLPSVVDTDHYKPGEPCTPRPLSDSFTVGWIGSPSTAPYLQSLVEPLRQLALERPVRLLVVGGPAPVIPGVEVIEQSWSLETEVPLIQRFDVGVMPLPDTAWARGKCAYKLIQCMACGVPVVASPVGANVDAVPAACGILASSSGQWLDAFRHLAADPELRQRMGASGRRWVQERYSLHSALPILAGVIRQVVETHP